MVYQGIVQNGRIVLEDGEPLPEGANVTVTVARHVDESNGAPSAEPTIWQKLAKIGEEVESLPCDLPSDYAANHDHYLHGLPRRT